MLLVRNDVINFLNRKFNLILTPYIIPLDNLEKEEVTSLFVMMY